MNSLNRRIDTKRIPQDQNADLLRWLYTALTNEEAEPQSGMELCFPRRHESVGSFERPSGTRTHAPRDPSVPLRSGAHPIDEELSVGTPAGLLSCVHSGNFTAPRRRILFSDGISTMRVMNDVPSEAPPPNQPRRIRSDRRRATNVDLWDTWEDPPPGARAPSSDVPGRLHRPKELSLFA